MSKCKRSIDFWYTLLAIIHDGEKQGPYPHHRILFDWEGKENKSPENILGFAVWSFYVKGPLEEQFAKSISFDRRESYYRSIIREALNETYIDLEPLLKAVKNTATNNTQQNPTRPEGEWSNPATKRRFMSILGIDSVKTFNAFTSRYGIQQAGNRQTWRMRLDTLDKKIQTKLGKL